VFDFGTVDDVNACASVFTTQNSTPWISVSTILFTAFEPPPPTPMTYIFLIRAARETVSKSFSE
jgi:hypothetical protein